MWWPMTIRTTPTSQPPARRRPAGKPGRPGGADPRRRAPHLHGPLRRGSAVADARARVRAGHPRRADAGHERLRAGRADARHRAHARTSRSCSSAPPAASSTTPSAATRSGAVDFLYKPLDPHAVRSKVNVFVELFRAAPGTAGSAGAAAARGEHARRLHVDGRARAAQPAQLASTCRRSCGARCWRGPRPPDRAAMLQHGRARRAPDPQHGAPDRRHARRLAHAHRPPGHRAGGLRPGRVRARRSSRRSGAGEGAAACRSRWRRPSRCRCVGDEFRIEQVITNLLTNALRYGGGKPVAVTRGQREDGNEAVRVACATRAWASPPADQERIFEQFERTEGAAQVAGPRARPVHRAPDRAGAPGPAGSAQRARAKAPSSSFRCRCPRRPATA